MYAQANVEQLLRLADKYDMDAVRSTCAAFLACNISQMALSHPLDSPRNLLHAASLAERYLKDRFSSSAASSTTSISVSAASASASAGPSSLSPSTAQSYVEAISAALGKALEPARFKGTYTPNSYSYSGRQPEVDTWRENARPVVARLAALMEEAKGRDILTPDVQVGAGHPQTLTYSAHSSRCLTLVAVLTVICGAHPRSSSTGPFLAFQLTHAQDQVMELLLSSLTRLTS